MSKPDITLQPSKGVISEAAARIYAGYVAAGRVEDENAKSWIKRSIREAIIIAKTVDASVESHDALAVEETIIVRPNAHSARPGRPRTKSRATKKAKPRKAKATIEDVAEEVLMDDAPKEETVELEKESGESDKEDLSHESAANQETQPQPEDDSAVVAAEALKRMSRTSPSVSP